MVEREKKIAKYVMLVIVRRPWSWTRSSWSRRHCVATRKYRNFNEGEDFW